MKMIEAHICDHLRKEERKKWESLRYRYGYHQFCCGRLWFSMAFFCKIRYCKQKTLLEEGSKYYILSVWPVWVITQLCVKQFQMWTLYTIIGIAFGGPCRFTVFGALSRHKWALTFETVLPEFWLYWYLICSSHRHINSYNMQKCRYITVPYSPYVRNESCSGCQPSWLNKLLRWVTLWAGQTADLMQHHLRALRVKAFQKMVLLEKETCHWLGWSSTSIEV